MTLGGPCARPKSYLFLTLSLEVTFYIPCGARSQLIGHCSVVRCGHRGARIRVNIGSSITTLCSATGIHIERVPYVDPLVSQW